MLVPLTANAKSLPFCPPAHEKKEFLHSFTSLLHHTLTSETNIQTLGSVDLDYDF